MATGTKPTSAAAILETLRQHPDATAAEVADRAGIGRSTATKALADLAAEGHVTRQRGGRVNGRVSPDRWSLVAASPAAAEQSPAKTPPAEPGDATTAMQDQPHGDNAAEQPGGTPGTVEVETTTTATAQVAQPTGNGASAPRLGHGALRDLVRGYLADRPGQACTPHQIAKALGRSAGAVSNALTSKALQDQVIQTSQRPRRYMIPSQPAGTAEAEPATAR